VLSVDLAEQQPCFSNTLHAKQKSVSTGDWGFMKSNFGNTSRAPQFFPVKAVDGKLVVSGVPGVHVGVKRTT
jgi:hypothetical protein